MKKEEANKEEKKQSKKWIKWGIWGIVIFIILSGATFIYNYFKTMPVNSGVSDYSQLITFEDGSYYLINANKKITFDIIAEEGINEELFKITDEEENEIDSTIEQKNEYITIKPPKGNYKDGNTYTLTLKNATFKNEELKEVKTLIFKIEQKEVSEYSYKDNVKELSKASVELKNENDVISLKAENGNYNENDVIILNDNGKFEAYKVEKIENGIVNLTTPEISDIYDNLKIYKEYDIDYNSIVINKEIEEQVEIAFKESQIYKLLINESKAASPETKIKITPSKNGINMNISITIYPNGESNLGMEALKNHKVTINFNYNFGCKPTLDIDFPKKMEITTKISQDLDFEIDIVPDEEILKGTKDLVEEEYNKQIANITDYLYNMKFDTTTGSQKIVSIPMETSIPGITFDVDLFTISNFNLAVETKFKHKTSNNLTIGVLINKNGCKPYKTKLSSEKETEFTIMGKSNFEFGIELDNIFVVFDRKIAYAGLITEGGVYGDMYVTFPIIHKNKDEGLINSNVVGDLEIGKFLRARYEAKVNLIVKQIDEKNEILNDKEVALKYKNDTVIVGIKPEKESVNIEDGKIEVPKIKLQEKNILTNEIEEKEIEISKLTFKSGDNKLEVNDNKIEVAEKDDEIIVVYKEEEKEYETSFKITFEKFELKEEYEYKNDMAIDISVRFLANNVIVYGDKYASCYYVGTYKIEKNKAIGTLTEVTYLDHEKTVQKNEQNGGFVSSEYTTKKCKGEVNFELLNNKNIKLLNIKTDVGFINVNEKYTLKPVSNKKAGTTKLETNTTKQTSSSTTTEKKNNITLKNGTFKLTNEAKNYREEDWYLADSFRISINMKKDNTFDLHGGDTVHYYGTYSIKDNNVICKIKQENMEGEIKNKSIELKFKILSNNKIQLIKKDNSMIFYAANGDIFAL